MNNTRRHPHSTDQLPKAKIEYNWKTYTIWLVPVAAVVLAAWFVYSNVFKGGPTLHILFNNAAGLEPGKSQLKYRGTRIGEVREVQLTKDHKWAEVTIALDGSAESVAREGSRFWIVQPEVGTEQIRALRTIVSGDYVAVEPGEGKRQTKFTGLTEAPVIEPKGTLRIVLLAEKLGSVKKRAPVFYRGVQVGQVFDCDLGKTSQTIRITVDIHPRYAPLVRMNSKFWNAGGIHATLSLSGINVAAQSAEALIAGGVAFATPDASDKQAPAGTSFRLYDKPDDTWLAWSPPIELSEDKTGSDSQSNLGTK